MCAGWFGRSRRPLAVILGSGSTLRAGAPSTQELTALVASWCSARADQPGKICSQVIDALKSNYTNVNFEFVIAALEDLEPIAAAHTRRPMVDETRPVIASFLLANSIFGTLPDPTQLNEARHLVLHEIAEHCMRQTARSDITALKSILQRLSSDFSVSVFTLNYDDLIDRAVDFDDGFTTRQLPRRIMWAHQVLRFDAQEFTQTRRSGKDFLAHMHGSVRFGYQIECEDNIVKYDRAVDAVASLFTSRTSGSIEHGNIMTAGPIISGFNKVAKLAGNPEPYGHYYAAFTESLLGSNRLLVVGYGGMDSYVNTWLKEWAKTHGNSRRIAWITKIPGEDVGSGRPDIKLIKDLAGPDGFVDADAYNKGIPFQVQKTIALECRGFPIEEQSLNSILRHLSS